MALPCRRCGAEARAGTKRCSVCGISRPGSLLRASIIRPAVLVFIWVALLIAAYRLW